MEFGTIEREIYVEASPEIVFEVVSSPDHLKEWWPDDARYEPTPGSAGEIVFGDRDAGGAVVPFTVVDARPPRTFSFRWTHPADEVAAEGNSLLVTFDLTPSGGGTLLKMTETGFREMGWEAPSSSSSTRSTSPAGTSTCRGWRRTSRRWRCGHEHRGGREGRRRPLVRDRGPDPAPDARPAALDGDGTATTLGQQLPVTRQAVAKHLGVLDRVGLVRATPAGREKRYRVDDAQLARAVAQLSSVGSAWDARLQRIKRIAEAIQRTQQD